MSSVIFFFGPMAFMEAFVRAASRTHPLYTNRAAHLMSLLPQESADAAMVQNIIDSQIEGFRRVAAMCEEGGGDIRHRIHKTMPLDLAYRVIRAVKEAIVTEIGCLEAINQPPS